MHARSKSACVGGVRLHPRGLAAPHRNLARVLPQLELQLHDALVGALQLLCQPLYGGCVSPERRQQTLLLLLCLELRVAPLQLQLHLY